MLDIKFIRENSDIVQAAIKNKNRQVDLTRILTLADERKEAAQKVADLNRQKNEAAASRDIEMGERIKDQLKDAEASHEALEKELVKLLMQIPNVPSPDTPVGPDESENKVIRSWGEIPQFSFTPKEHWDIGATLGLLNTQKAGDVSGARFAYLMGDLVQMQFALLNFAFSILTSKEKLDAIAKETGIEIDTKPFIPVLPPVMMRSQVMNRMARLDPIDERYYFEKDDMVFVGSAEHTLGPLHMDEMLEEKEFPIRYVGYSTAFRREAGSYGKDTKGILRLHQFDKIEIETFTRPEDGYKEQDFIVALQEHVMRALKLPHQVMLVCTGDMGFPDQRQIDIETWMPGQGKYRETHSSDYVGGFQARRLNTRIKRADGTVEPVHMNDATVFAMGRTLIAIMENYQQEDGSIVVPEVLRPYMGKEVIRKVDSL